MRKMLKKVMTVFTAGVMAASVASLAACSGAFQTPSGIPDGTVSSNGGFAVEKGNYVYFINGVDAYTSDNTYGAPVKGSLVRIQKDKLAENGAEVVIPSLMVASDYTSGIYIYGDRVYYATPNNVKNTEGVIEQGYLDFKSAKLDGTDIEDIFQVSDNATVYRYVEVSGTVYLLYVTDSDLHSVNTATGDDTTLAAGMGAYVLNSTDKTDPVVYYTMSVTPNLDVIDGGGTARSYNQIYRVSAETTKAPYEYKYDEKYLEANDGKEPYTNLGTIVLDGIGSTYTSDPTQFTHDLGSAAPATPIGYSYTLQAYNNGGIYFTRSDLATTSTTGESGWLYFLDGSKVSSGWNSISGNASLDVIAQSTTNAGAAAIFYRDNAGHHYIYVSGSNIIRADVMGNVGMAETTTVAFGVSGATLVCIDNTSDATYHYVYYTRSGSTGNNIYRAVYNGSTEDYKTLGYDENKPYEATQILSVEHARSWYNFEIIGNTLYYADAESVGSSYNYISCVDLANDSGSLMNNVELSEFNDKYNGVIGADGYVSSLSGDNRTKLATALRYYFYTDESEQFYANIDEAVKEGGKSETYLYSKEDQDDFEQYVLGEGDAAEFKSHRTRSAFINRIGIWTEADEETLSTYWKNSLEHYTAPVEEEPAGLPGWAWALIGVGIGLIVIGIGLAIFFILRGRKEEPEEEEEKMYVDTTDDKDVDVYGTGSVTPEEVPEVSEEISEEEAEPSEEAEESATDEEVAEEVTGEAEAPAEEKPEE